jgi:hypothetical protein
MSLPWHNVVADRVKHSSLVGEPRGHALADPGLPQTHLNGW